jgi:hypothetical protein
MSLFPMKFMANACKAIKGNGLRDGGWEWHMSPMVHLHIAQHASSSLETHVSRSKDDNVMCESFIGLEN